MTMKIYYLLIGILLMVGCEPKEPNLKRDFEIKISNLEKKQENLISNLEKKIEHQTIQNDRQWRLQEERIDKLNLKYSRLESRRIWETTYTTR